MRSHAHRTDMDFRVLPSAIPLQSPSPDKKNSNNIAPTLSPSPIEINKSMTPNRQPRGEKENTKHQFERSTQMKYATHSPGVDFSKTLKEKDQVIKNLKNIIDIITDNGRRASYEEQEDNDLKKQVRILTIQNQKLVNIIEKMSKGKDSKPEETTQVQEQYQREIGQLMNTMKIHQEQHSEEQKELKKLYKALNTHCRTIEEEKRELERQNQKLMKILKDRNESDKKMNEKSRISDQSEVESEKSHKSHEKVTLLKIKEQYAENMKLLRDGLVKQIEETFDTMRIALEGIGGKVSTLAMRLESIEKLSWQRVKAENAEKEQTSPLPFNKNYKSEIYIEEGPESSQRSQRSQQSHQTSKDEFSRMDISRPLSADLQEEMNKLKTELEQLRFKYEKICLDTSSIAYSKLGGVGPAGAKKEREEYDRMAKQVESKDRQIEILYEQIRKMEEENLSGSSLKEYDWRQAKAEHEREVQSIKEEHLNEISQMRSETELKVKLLIENYEKQIEMLKKQIILKNMDLHETKQSTHLERSESTKKVQDLQERVTRLEEEKEALVASKQRVENLLLDSQKERQGLIEENELMNTRIAGIQDERKTDKLKQQQMEADMSESVANIDRLTRELEESKQSLNQLYLQLQRQQQDNKGTQKEIEDLRQTYESKIIELKAFQSSLPDQSLLKQIDELRELVNEHIKSAVGNSASVSYEEDRTRQQVNELRQQLLEKEEKCIRQEARIIELEGLCELHRSSHEEIQNLYLQTTRKLSELEQQTEHLQERLRDNPNEAILEKLDKLRIKEQSRLSRLSTVSSGFKAFEDPNN